MVTTTEGHLECPECGLWLDKHLLYLLKGVSNETDASNLIDMDGDEHAAYLGIGSLYPAMSTEDD